MLDFQRLKEQEHHCLLELDEKKRKGGLPVSQLFPHASTFHRPCVSQPRGTWVICSDGG